MFYHITTEMKWSEYSIIWENKEDRILDPNNIIRTVLIISETESTDINKNLLFWYESIGKCNNIMFYFVDNVDLNAINDVINIYEGYCSAERSFTGKLSQKKMEELWFNFYLIPSIVFSTDILDEKVINIIKEKNKM